MGPKPVVTHPCYAFIDESGSVGPASGSHFLIIVVICCGEPRPLELIIRKAQKKFGASLSSGEMKANKSREEIIFRMLSEIARMDLSIIAVAVDQRVISRPPADLEDIYRQAVARATYLLVERWPRVEIYLDSRYTSKAKRYQLEKCMREKIVDLPQQLVLVNHENSQVRKEIQIADFVAWAFFQKYEKGDARFYAVIASKVIKEELMLQKNWRIEIKKKNPPYGGS